MGKRITGGLVAAAAAAMLVAPAAPASAATSDLTCHPPNYDTVSCACVAVVTVLRKVTGDPWTCA